MSDAAPLAEVLLGVLGSSPRPVTDDERSRVTSRCAPLAFEHLKPCFASIERDPIHPAAGYLCVDGVDGQPLLVRAAPASSPSSGLFPKSILIGRTHLRQFEVVINAIPFGPEDAERIEVFCDRVNRAFRPKPPGSKPVIVVHAASPAQTLPLVFEALRRRLKATGRAYPAFPEASAELVAWAAIRSGWREGYALEAFESVAATVEVAEGMTAEAIFDIIASA